VTIDVVVCGYGVRHPLAGNMVAYAHYVAGLHRLGHRVVYLEESGWDRSCYHPNTGGYDNDPTDGLDAMASVLAELGCGDVPVWYLDRAGNRWYRTEADRVRRRLSGADAVINVGGVCLLDEFALADRTALIDLDPGFTQTGHFGASAVGAYDLHFSYGTNLGAGDCLVPDDGVAWIPTVPPVVMDYWHAGDHGPASRPGVEGSASGPATAWRTTTVANIDAYGETEIDGRSYGQKRAELERLGDVPRRLALDLAVTAELAMTGADDATGRMLTANGWRLEDGQGVSADMETYRRYVVDSDAEFSVAKEAYVALRTGWFSDRSVCYLAAGRPVVVQDTGFHPPGATRTTGGEPSGGADGPTGVGLGDGGILIWATAQEAYAAVAELTNRYGHHRDQARALARAVFDHQPVLTRLLKTMG
jgi:hypothetical protein